MKKTEAQAVARLAGQAARGVARLVQGTQNAVTDSTYAKLTRWLGPAVRPIFVAHRAAAQHAYFWVHTGLAAAALAARTVAFARADDEGTLGATPRSRGVLGVLNGVSGDHLHRDGSPLALPMTLRHGGRDVALTPGELREAYGRGHHRIAVFVHGLVETEDAWRYRAFARWGQPGGSYGGRLHEDLGYLPLEVCYNTGRRVAANGAALGQLLRGLVEAWPDRVDEVLVVGHSMGGLVALAALTQSDDLHALPLRAVVTLGSPRDGAPLERCAASLHRWAHTMPSAHWLGALLDVRSEGVKDLQTAAPPAVPAPASVGQYAVLSTLTPSPASTVGAWIGDGLVPVPHRHTVETTVVGGLHHLDLLNHPRVYERLASWLASCEAARHTVGGR